MGVNYRKYIVTNLNNNLARDDDINVTGMWGKRYLVATKKDGDNDNNDIKLTGDLALS